MNKAKQFGETVEGYNIPVLNEREIRASAGILYFFMFLAWMLVIFNENYFLIKFVNTIFLTDFIIRVMISPKYSPSLIIGRLIVGGQTPEYVGAAQKKFAWTIGLVLATIIFLLLVVMNSTSFITGIICQICLIFLFFEAVFGLGQIVWFIWLGIAMLRSNPSTVAQKTDAFMSRQSTTNI